VAAFLTLPVSSGASEVYGSPDDPLVATVLGTEVRTGDADEMRYVILSKLMERYAAEQEIAVSREDIGAYLDGMHRKAEQHRKQNEAKRDELTRKLASESLTEAERASLSEELASLNELMEALEEGSKASEADAAEDAEYREQVATAFVRQWKINRALYRQYGGRVIFQQGGPEPLDAYRRFLEEQEKSGAFTILKKGFEEKFWDYFRNDSLHSFYPPGSDGEKQAIETPWWQAGGEEG
jgi:hypothetical protein